MVDARLPADTRMPRGARVNVVLPPLSLNGPTVTIRLFPKAYALAEPDQARAASNRPTRRAARGLRPGPAQRRSCPAAPARARRRCSTRCPRSSPSTERIVTIEDAAELSPAPAARHPARDPPAEHRGPRAGHDPRPRAQLAAHAPRPDHRRRGPRRRGARHAAGDEHRPRGVARHGARQQPAATRWPGSRRWPR